MNKISDAVRTIVTHNALLSFGIHHRLLNLSQVARYIRPLVAARTLKSVQTSAIAMALSRLQTTLGEPSKTRELFLIDQINIHTGLCSVTVAKTRKAHACLNQLFTAIQESSGYMTITEGLREMTAIISEQYFADAERLLGGRWAHVHRDLASVGVAFNERYLEIPGVLYLMLQQLALQNINVVEVSSTATEFNIYLREQDVRLAFDSLYGRFTRRGQQI